jgi:predicted ribosomally synthesized peptide with nif11-like leader
LFQLSFYPKIFPNLSLSISIDTVKAFFAKVTSDPELTKKAKAIGTSDWKATEAFAKSLGFDFDDDDLIAYHKQNLPSSADLDEAELSSVSGGTVSVSTSAVVLAGVGTYITASSATQATSSGSW